MVSESELCHTLIHTMKRFIKENGLSMVLFGLFFAAFMGGQTWTGYLEHNSEREEHGASELSLRQYIKSPHFLEATMENWESEFLQMGIYVFLTAFLYQKGSAESKSLTEPEEVDRDPRLSREKPDAPWPVRRGGWILILYEHSLTLAFVACFLGCFLLHAVSGRAQYNDDQLLHGAETVTLGQYFTSSRFWFESLQNWQSEFLAIGCMVVFSIWLRQRGSPESKPVDSPHSQTGSK